MSGMLCFISGFHHYVVENIFFIHATGRAEYEKYRANETARARILPYIEDMPPHLAAADIAVTRCGAMTIAELSAAGVPAILIPSPNVTANHQYKNANATARMGGAVTLSEGELDTGSLRSLLTELSRDTERRDKMRRANRGHRECVEAKIRAAVAVLLDKK